MKYRIKIKYQQTTVCFHGSSYHFRDELPGYRGMSWLVKFDWSTISLVEFEYDWSINDDFQVLKDPKKPTKKSNFWRVRYEKVSCIVMRDIAAIQYHLRGATGGIVTITRQLGLFSHPGLLGAPPGLGGVPQQNSNSGAINGTTGGGDKPVVGSVVGTTVAADGTASFQEIKKKIAKPKMNSKNSNANAFLMDSILKTPFQEKPQQVTSCAATPQISTLYANPYFNLQRPRAEVDFLFTLLIAPP